MRRPCARQRQRHDHPHYRVMTKAKPLPPLELLRTLFDYEEETGALIWIVSPSRRVKVGDKAGTISRKGYLRIAITIDKKFCNFAAHRLIWYFVTGTDPGELQIDHIDSNKLNNRFSNLRLATNSQNNCNRRASLKSKAGLKGVSYYARSKKWCASISIQGKQFYLGLFDSPELAHMAYCKAAAELHGEFARGA